MEGKRRRRNKLHRICLSFLLALAVLIGSMPLSGFTVQAAEEETGEEAVKAQGAGDTPGDGAAGARASATTGSRFKHPGLLYTQEGFDKMWENVQNEVSPNKETWDALWWDTFSNPGWWPRPLEGVTRGGKDNINQLRIDIKRAHQNALIWKLSGDEAHGEAACRIMNAWSSTMKWLGGNADRFLAAGLQGYELANIGEMMRDHPDFDTEGLQNLLLNVFYPMNDDFMIRHNDAYIGNYWANWELANLASMISIGVYCDREDIYERALNYFKTGKGNGSFYHTMPYVFEQDSLVQWQESVRDQGHTSLGIVLAGVIMETAWNQGDNLYDRSDNRFMKAVEYTIQYNNLGQDVPSTAYEYRKGKNGQIEWYAGVNPYQRGNWRPIYYQMYNHYVNRKGLEMPNMEQMIKNANGTYIEGAPGNSLDELGWYSLTYANTGERVEDVPVEGELSDGVYRICSAASGKSLVVNEEGNLASAAKGTRKDEWWLVENKGDAEYTLTNMATGKRMQLNSNGNSEDRNGYYSYGTQIGTGDAVDSLTQSFAFLAEDDGSFRIVPSLNYLVLALEGNNHADNTRVVQWRNDAWGAYWNSNNPAQRWKVEKATEQATEFTFDEEESGFSTEYASLEGEYQLQRHGSGKALALDGQSGFQTVVTTTGKSVLAGETEFTISFDMRPKAGNENWLFYAAPDAASQTQAQATYIGLKEKDGTVSVESCRNGSLSAAQASVSSEVGSGSWYKAAAVFTKTETILYINGKEMARVDRGYAIPEILGADGIMQIGKANLENSKLCQGAVDNFKITGHAMTADEALAEASEYAEGSLPEVLADFTFDDKEHGFAGGTAVAKGSYSLTDHAGGKAIYLDGWRDFLKVTKADGSPLVSGGLLKEMTVSMQVKMEGGTGWVLYASSDNVHQTVNWERYIGILDQNGTITAQRFNNQGVRDSYAEGPGRADIWHHIAIVFTENDLTIYDNGEKVVTTDNDVPLYNILGGESIWQIGKANWGGGEYFRGFLDNYKIISRAWSEDEVRAEALKYVDKGQLQAAVEKQYAEGEEKYSQEQKRWEAYRSALKTAQEVLADTGAKQSAVDSAAENLNKVQAWMRMDEALHDSVDEGRQPEYTAKSWTPYATALKNAKELYAKETADAGITDAMAEETAQALKDAQAALRNKQETIEEAKTQISSIGEITLTPGCSRKVILARQVCSLLNEEELALVTNLSQLEIAEAAMTDYLAEFTFDDDENGFIGGQAVAEGDYEIRNGALYLDGNGKCLDVTKGDGSSLLTGREELTISFAASPESGGSNWFFFAAPNRNAQELNQETYLAMAEFEETITAERYKNSGERPAAASIGGIDTSGWVYVTLVCTVDKSTVYINGEKKASADSSIALSDIFGENGILQIGKGNWGSGEYYTGYLDNFKILGTAMTEADIQSEAQAFLGAALDVKKIDQVISQIDHIGLVEANIDVRTKIAQARELYESLTEDEKKLVTNLKALADAEELYHELASDAEAVLGEISIDGAGGIQGSGIKVEAHGTPVFADDTERGKVLSLDGTGSVWLNLTKEDGSSLLTGVEELTISYYSKAEQRTENNWAFFAAPNADPQTYTHEYYLGAFENGGKVTAERYLDGRQEMPVADCTAGWNHIVIIYGANYIKIYVNGILAQEKAVSGGLKDILGESSVLQIGKANWGNGEFYKGLLDDFSVYNYAFTERDIDILEGKIVNPRPLKEQILQAKVVNQDYYTPESYAALQTAIKEARKSVDTMTTQEELAAALQALQSAMDNLERLPLNDSALAGKIAEAKAIAQGSYTSSSYAALQSAIEEAEQMMANALLQEELDEALKSLQEAIDGLVAFDKKALTDKIAEAKAIQQGDYTDESYAALQAAIQSAEEAADAVNTESALQAVIRALQEAIDGLSTSDVTSPLDKKALTDKIAEAKGIEKGDYTDESYEALQAAIRAAEEALGAIKTEEALQAAVKDLQEAIDGLSTSDVTSPLNKKALTDKIAEAKGIEKGDYTDESYEALQAAIRAAEEALGAIKTEEALQAAVKDLQEAIDGLQKKTTEPNPGPGTQPTPLKPVKTVKAAQQPAKQYVKVSFRKVNGAASYDIYRSTKQKSGYKKVGSVKKTSFVDKKVKASKTYYYKVRAKSAKKGCDSTLSAKYAKVKVLGVPKVKAKASKGRKVTVSWKKIKGANGYIVYTSAKKNKGFQAMSPIKKAKTVKKVVTAKKKAKIFYVKVRPYYTVKGKKVLGTYSKVSSVKAKK
ncbi:MAG: hypothetical protein HFH36_01605 [Lachnospiraceae bacterium]|nr:hypothetical protein [Lachnospiraceae bacterium]